MRHVVRESLFECHLVLLTQHLQNGPAIRAAMNFDKSVAIRSGGPPESIQGQDLAGVRERSLGEVPQLNLKGFLRHGGPALVERGRRA